LRTSIVLFLQNSPFLEGFAEIEVGGYDVDFFLLLARIVSYIHFKHLPYSRFLIAADNIIVPKGFNMLVDQNNGAFELFVKEIVFGGVHAGAFYCDNRIGISFKEILSILLFQRSIRLTTT
jgi:hypothetical protein